MHAHPVDERNQLMDWLMANQLQKGVLPIICRSSLQWKATNEIYKLRVKDDYYLEAGKTAKQNSRLCVYSTKLLSRCL